MKCSVCSNGAYNYETLFFEIVSKVDQISYSLKLLLSSQVKRVGGAGVIDNWISVINSLLSEYEAESSSLITCVFILLFRGGIVV